MTDSATNKSSRRRLGRGLSSLISSPVEVAPSNTGSAGHHDQLVFISLDAIRPNPHQPRRDFDEAGLASLASSIRVSGVMQPILVRPLGDGYELVAGERRWRAAKRADLATIPAIVRAIDSRTSAEWSLVENLQREDLNPVERARAFARLIEEFSLTHQEIAERVGLNRSSVTNHLRLLELDEASLDALRKDAMTIGHAKALLAITNNEARDILRDRAIAEGWSVRELERRVREAQSGGGGTPAQNAQVAPTPQAAHLRDLEKRLGDHFGTDVRIRTGKTHGSGELLIRFFDLDQFGGVLERCGFEMDL